MRVLFSYFYASKASFKDDSIFRFSKKYNVNLSNDISSNSINIDLIKNITYQEDFYASNVDIGVVIGENGTGKSVLLNSFRDKNNDYSLIIYEIEEQFFFLSETNKNIKLTVNDILTNIEKTDNFQYIYYSSIIDTSSEDVKSTYNISNRSLLSNNEHLSLKNRLSLIENDDIQKYFSMKDRNIVNYTKIETIRLHPSNTYFDELEELLRSNINLPELISIIADSEIKVEKKIIYSLIDKLDEKKKFNIINKRINSPSDMIDLLYKSQSLNKKYSSYLTKILVKKHPFYKTMERYTLYIKKFFENYTDVNNFIKKSQIEIGEALQDLRYNGFFQNIRDASEYNYTENRYYKLILHQHSTLKEVLDSVLDEYINYQLTHDLTDYLNKYLAFSEDISELAENDNFRILLKYNVKSSFIDIFRNLVITELIGGYARNINSHTEKDKIIKKITAIIDSIINIYKIDLMFELFYTSEELFDDSISSEIIYQLNQSDYFHISTILDSIDKSNNDIYKIIEEYLMKNIDYILVQNSYNLTNDIVKLIFLLTFKNYYESLDLEVDKLALLNFLNDIYSSQIDKNLFLKLSKLNKQINDLYEHINNENIHIDEVMDINETFFDTYKKLLNNAIKPFTYELEPALSSGQKAILFIFSRIDDAIKKINKQTSDSNILILLDEADLKLHMEWQRKFINDLVYFLNMYSKNKFYILYATHSPMILSDITDDRAIFLKKQDDGFSIDKSEEDKQRTFGANIYDLYHDSFFMNEFMGEFAQKKINDVINIINIYKISENIESSNNKIDDFLSIYDLEKIIKSYNYRYKTTLEPIDLEKKYTEILERVKEDKNNLNNIIVLIGEPLLRNKLLDDLKIIGIDNSLENIIESFNSLSREDIEEKLKEYDRETQNQVLKELFYQSRKDD